MGKTIPNPTKKASERKEPADLQKILAADLKAKAKWERLTPIARRDFLSWIEEAKLPETRKRRVESVPSRLASGKRRPCCYAIVPMNLYKALSEDPEAKAEWKNLSPEARRDFIDWINSASESEERGVRIVRACDMLAKGRMHP